MSKKKEVAKLEPQRKLTVKRHTLRDLGVQGAKAGDVRGGRTSSGYAADDGSRYCNQASC